jgi:hypothetical protein
MSRHCAAKARELQQQRGVGSMVDKSTPFVMLG